MKNCPKYAPEWLSRTTISYGENKKINWITINKLEDLIWITNKTSIELHTWFSTTSHLENPDFAVFDLDPGANINFDETIDTVKTIVKILNELNLNFYIKTSGKRGMHIFIPILKIYTYSQIRNFLQNITKLLIEINPNKITDKWQKKKRKGKLYIDYRQNAQGKTIPAPYSLRPTPEATVSTPIKETILNSNFSPTDYTLQHIYDSLNTSNNRWKKILLDRQTLPQSLL